MIFLCFVFCYDVWFYCFHRLLHIPHIYRQFHYQHHVIKHPRWQDTFVASTIENSFSGLGLLVPLLWVDLNISFFWAWLFCACRGIARHDPRCSYIVGNHHLQHHLYPNTNFSAYYIDWICNTEFKPLPIKSEL
jgi:sterol desaturase/sphingolipid hydroxylase (fatty acid hydroxylase superfamily)